MLIDCHNNKCGIQFSSDSRRCPVCETENLQSDKPVIDHELKRAESRRRIIVGVVAGVFSVGYLINLGHNIASGMWAVIPLSLILLFVWFKIFKTAIDDKRPDRLD